MLAALSIPLLLAGIIAALSKGGGDEPLAGRTPLDTGSPSTTATTPPATDEPDPSRSPTAEPTRTGNGGKAGRSPSPSRRDLEELPPLPRTGITADGWAMIALALSAAGSSRIRRRI